MLEESFSLGIEEEFQLVDAQTGLLYAGIDRILEKGNSLLNGQLKAELVQSAVELVSNVCPTIASVRDELYRNRTLLAHVVEDAGMALISAGTHPLSAWQDQQITRRDRYAQLVENQQDAIRAQVIYGQHVHVGLKDKALAVRIMNQVRTWIPHLLALSTNSPFWLGRLTGINSYRSVLWQGGPRSGIPGVIASRENLDQYLADMIAVGNIQSGKDIWWDVRINTSFDTLEFRIFDMPATIEDTISLTALCQALIAKLVWLDKQGMEIRALPRDYIMENKWHAIRYGLDAEIADFVNMRRLPMRTAIHELLDFVDDVVDDLGSRREINYLRALLNDPKGTGADQQIAIYKQTGNLQDVVQHLREKTLQGIVSGAS